MMRDVWTVCRIAGRRFAAATNGRWVTLRSGSGFEYRVWERAVPRINEVLTRCVVYLYPSRSAAEEGKAVGGTGFLIDLPGETTGLRFTYLVTNAHVVDRGARTARVNTTSGSVDYLDIPPGAWLYHPDRDDVAVVPIELSDAWDVGGLVFEDFEASRERNEAINLGIGDEVLMLGRFIGHQGVEQNQPVARFGTIAMMPGPLVLDGRDMEVEAYLVEMHSLPGFSGSPVFAVIMGGTSRGVGLTTPLFKEQIGLLGIDSGHKSALHPVLERGTGQPVNPDWLVKGNSGIAIVVPTWKIRELLEEDELVKQRRDKEKSWNEKREHERGEADAAPSMESYTREDFTVDESTEYERFEALARTVVNVPKKDAKDKPRKS